MSQTIAPERSPTPKRSRSILFRVSSSLSRRIEKGYDRIRSLRKPSRSDRLPVSASESNYIIYDPQGPFLQRWNKYFVLCCLLSVSFDPLFFYIPVIDRGRYCLGLDTKLEIAASILRTVPDVFYILHMIFQFRTGFIAPTQRVFGQGLLLVKDTKAIAKRYIHGYFIVDILSVLPLPQLVLLVVVPYVKYQASLIAKETLKWTIVCQYVPRFIRIYPLFKDVTRSSGIFSEKAWVGASLSMFLYMLASHVFGALWYLFSIGRNDNCWRKACKENLICAYEYLYCDKYQASNNSFVRDACPPINMDSIDDFTKVFDFGIFADAVKSGVLESKDFTRKYLYCFWWGLRNLSSLGQNLATSTYEGEICFAVCMSIVGLLLFSIIIGNMLQKLLPSISAKIEEMKEKKHDIEQWMSYRMIPTDLRERIRRYEQYKWQQTRGIEEDSLVRSLPKDLRRDIKRHLCLDLVRRVPMFEIMDDQLLDAICERLTPVLYTENTYILRECDRVEEMLFIMRGTIESSTTGGGRSDFFNSVLLRAGDFCGEEPLTWALDPTSSANLPSSTRTVKALTEVEAFALLAEDLKLVAAQFRRLHSKQVQRTFRFYSQQWRTWAACFLQAAWRLRRQKKMLKSLKEEESRVDNISAKENEALPSFGATVYASRFAANSLRALRRNEPSRRSRKSEGLLPLPPSPLVLDDFLCDA